MEKLLDKLNAIGIAIDNIEDELIDAKNEFDGIYEEVYTMKKSGIVNVRLFKLKMQQEGLLTQEIDDFIENYLKFYNN